MAIEARAARPCTMSGSGSAPLEDWRTSRQPRPLAIGQWLSACDCRVGGLLHADSHTQGGMHEQDRESCGPVPRPIAPRFHASKPGMPPGSKRSSFRWAIAGKTKTDPRAGRPMCVQTLWKGGLLACRGTSQRSKIRDNDRPRRDSYPCEEADRNSISAPLCTPILSEFA